MSAAELAPYLIAEWDAALKLRFLMLAGTTCLIYDHCVTFAQEVEYFRNSSWSASKLLFFWNRYFAPLVSALWLTATLGDNLTDEFCSWSQRVIWVTDYISITVVQATVVLRVWYILSGRWLARGVILVAFATSITVSAKDFSVIFPTVGHIETNAVAIPSSLGGCHPPSVHRVWTIFAPYLGMQTVLFVATMWPLLRPRRQGMRSQVMTRLARDGGVFYLASFGAVAFTTIGSLQIHNPAILHTAVFSNFLLAISSISVSRLMLSIGSIASCLDTDPDTLLSTAELSRVTWRRGTHGEILVDVDTVEGHHDSDDRFGTASRGFYVTQAWVYDDVTLPIPGTGGRRTRASTDSCVRNLVTDLASSAMDIMVAADASV